MIMYSLIPLLSLLHPAAADCLLVDANPSSGYLAEIPLSAGAAVNSSLSFQISLAFSFSAAMYIGPSGLEIAPGDVPDEAVVWVVLNADSQVVFLSDTTESFPVVALEVEPLRADAMVFVSLELEFGESFANVTDFRLGIDSVHNPWFFVENASHPGPSYEDPPADLSLYIDVAAPDEVVACGIASTEEEIAEYYGGLASGMCGTTQAEGVWKSFMLPEPITPENPSFQYTIEVMADDDASGSNCVLVLSDEPIWEVPHSSVNAELGGEYTDIASRFRFVPEVGYSVEHCCCETPGACAANDTEFGVESSETIWAVGEPIPFRIDVDFDDATYNVTTGSGAGPVAVATQFVWKSPVTNTSQLRYARFAQLGSGAECRICPYTGDVATLTETPTTTETSSTSSTSTTRDEDSTMGSNTTVTVSSSLGSTTTTMGAGGSTPAGEGEGTTATGANQEAEVDASPRVTLAAAIAVVGMLQLVA